MAERRGLPFDPIAEAQRQWEAHGWGEAAAPMALVTSIMRVQQVLLAEADAVLRPFGLTFARYEILMLLWFSKTGRLPLGKVGERLQVNPASVTSAVDRLERDGLVERIPNPSDGRGTLAHLTRQGFSVARQATRQMNAVLFSDMGIDEAEMSTLTQTLRTLRRAAGDFDEVRPRG